MIAKNCSGLQLKTSVVDAFAIAYFVDLVGSGQFEAGPCLEEFNKICPTPKVSAHRK